MKPRFFIIHSVFQLQQILSDISERQQGQCTISSGTSSLAAELHEQVDDYDPSAGNGACFRKSISMLSKKSFPLS
jgi:trehalose-6-phosphatase